MGSLAPPETPKRVYFLTSPRTASNMFVKMVNLPEQPHVASNEYHGGYFFMQPFVGRALADNLHKTFDQLSETELENFSKTVQDCANNLQDLTESATEEGKTTFIKEHVNMLVKGSILDELLRDAEIGSTTEEPFTVHMNKETDVHTDSNPVFLPDNWLQTFYPVFLIRHPALNMPSFYRAQSESIAPQDTPSRIAAMRIMYALKPTCLLYDYYNESMKSQNPTSEGPLIIDAADLITHPVPVMKHFCNVTGFDFSKCQFNWEKASKETIDALSSDRERRFLSTLNASSGIVRSKAGGDIDIDIEAEKWKAEFGEEMAKTIEGFVRAAMPHYLYLRDRRWDPQSHLEEDM